MASKLVELLNTSIANPVSSFSRRLQGNYLDYFQEQINYHEKKNLKLRPTNGLIYPTSKRMNTVYINITAFCSECKQFKQSDGRYYIKVKKKPIDELTAVVDVTHNEHIHEQESPPKKKLKKVGQPELAAFPYSSPGSSDSEASSPVNSPGPATTAVASNHSLPETSKKPPENKIQVTGRDRFKIAQEIMNCHFGSSRKYQLALAERGVSKEEIPNDKVLRKIVSEYNLRYNISVDWYQNLLSTSATYATIPFKHFGGYVQSIQSWPTLQIGMFYEKQLEALNITDYNNRILHIEAADNFIGVVQNQSYNLIDPYKEILNYFFLIKNKAFLYDSQQRGTFIMGKNIFFMSLS